MLASYMVKIVHPSQDEIFPASIFALVISQENSKMHAAATAKYCNLNKINYWGSNLSGEIYIYIYKNYYSLFVVIVCLM